MTTLETLLELNGVNFQIIRNLFTSPLNLTNLDVLKRVNVKANTTVVTCCRHEVAAWKLLHATGMEKLLKKSFASWSTILSRNRRLNSWSKRKPLGARREILMS